MKKLIPYKGSKMILRGLILHHRSKVVSLTKIVNRIFLTKARSHDNSFASAEELKYTAWMANQDIEITDEEADKAIRHHYTNNDHHIQHFDGDTGDMDLISLLMYTMDVIARISYDPLNGSDHELYQRASKIIHEEVKSEMLESLISNTLTTMLEFDRREVRGIFAHEQKKETE
ncbi:MAG: DUF5662 family protein [Lachnospiraceae bacterium]|nr:DUF5662 family protein [Lachnospiraceae bacterium]